MQRAKVDDDRIDAAAAAQQAEKADRQQQIGKLVAGRRDLQSSKFVPPEMEQAYREELGNLGYQTIALDMSEFQKMDGGLSCLSLRF